MPSRHAASPWSNPATASSVEVVVGGRMYPSLKDYKRYEAFREERKLLTMQALEAILDSKSAAVRVPDAVPAAASPLQAAPREESRSGIDANGWKTIRLGGVIVMALRTPLPA